MDAVTDAAGDKRADVVFQLACIDRTPQEFQQQLHSLQDQGDEGAPIWKKSASRFGIDWRSIVSAALFERPAPLKIHTRGQPPLRIKDNAAAAQTRPQSVTPAIIECGRGLAIPKIGGQDQ